MFNVYQVKFRDTLSSIAKDFGITEDELKMINGIDGIKFGDFIVVPSKNKLLKYEIKNGDTLYSIAANYNVPLDILISLNGLNKDDYIYPGEKIMIPNNDLGVYQTKENGTLNDLLKISNLEDLLRQNSNIYLIPNQLIYYTKE